MTWALKLHTPSLCCDRRTVQAASELKSTTSKLSKIVKAATRNAEDEDSNEKKRVALTLKKALEISNVAEKRIDDRAVEIDNRFQAECLSP